MDIVAVSIGGGSDVWAGGVGVGKHGRWECYRTLKENLVGGEAPET